MARPLADTVLRQPRLAEMAREADPSTNLFETPLRYSSPTSVYAGTPESIGIQDAAGAVLEKRPSEVYLQSDWIADPRAANVLAHEGTHSKMLSKGIRKAPESIKPALMELLKNDPEFFAQYTGFKAPYSKVKPEDMAYFLSDDEILARLSAIDAGLPKGTTLEKSRYGPSLFKARDSLDDYLRTIIPEGYLSTRSTRSFRPTYNQTTVSPNSLWNTIKRLLPQGK